MNFHFSWNGLDIQIENWHRPLAAYMAAFLESGLNLTFFAEPAAVSGEASRQANHRRVPWFVVMEWRRPASSPQARGPYRRSASSVSPLPTAPKMSPSTMRADGTALVIALRTWASFTEPPVRNTASISSAASPA